MTPLQEYFKETGRGAQTELAEKLNTSKSYLGQIARGERFPGRELAKLIAAETGIPPAKLMGFEEA